VSAAPPPRAAEEKRPRTTDEMGMEPISNPNPNPSPSPDPNPDPDPNSNPNPNPNSNPNPNPNPDPDPDPNPDAKLTPTLALTRHGASVQWRHRHTAAEGATGVCHAPREQQRAWQSSPKARDGRGQVREVEYRR
jgi:outer membrane biosynthesis protein TonB